MIRANGTGRRAALDELGRSFKAAMASVRRLRGRETHRPGDLSFAQYSLLFSLADGDELPTGELALRADLSPATATEMLEGLATAGLVERRRSPDDGRVVLTSLTPHGNERIAARRAEIEPSWRRALQGFNEADLRASAAVLERLAAMFDEMARDPEGHA